MAYGILIPPTRNCTWPSAVKVPSPSHLVTREFTSHISLKNSSTSPLLLQTCPKQCPSPTTQPIAPQAFMSTMYCVHMFKDFSMYLKLFLYHLFPKIFCCPLSVILFKLRFHVLCPLTSIYTLLARTW